MKITHRNLLVFVLDEYPEKHDSADGSAKETLVVASDDNFRDIVSFSSGFYERHSVQQQGPFEPPLAPLPYKFRNLLYWQRNQRCAMSYCAFLSAEIQSSEIVFP